MPIPSPHTCWVSVCSFRDPSDACAHSSWKSKGLGPQRPKVFQFQGFLCRGLLQTRKCSFPPTPAINNVYTHSARRVNRL